jgi:hypothetical protein
MRYWPFLVLILLFLTACQPRGYDSANELQVDFTDALVEGDIDRIEEMYLQSVWVDSLLEKSGLASDVPDLLLKALPEVDITEVPKVYTQPENLADATEFASMWLVVEGNGMWGVIKTPLMERRGRWVLYPYSFQFLKRSGNISFSLVDNPVLRSEEDAVHMIFSQGFPDADLFERNDSSVIVAPVIDTINLYHDNIFLCSGKPSLSQDSSVDVETGEDEYSVIFTLQCPDGVLVKNDDKMLFKLVVETENGSLTLLWTDSIY